MKQKVIKVLANKDLNPKQKFNELLTLYREHRAHVPQTMRYLNSVGFSPINLKNLEYDIQKLYEIKDVEIADQKHAVADPAKSKKTEEEIYTEVYELAKSVFVEGEALTTEQAQQLLIDAAAIQGHKDVLNGPEKTPEFSKGLPGNKEMAEWLKERNVEHKATKKDDLLAEVEKQLQKEYQDALSNYVNELYFWMKEEEQAQAEAEAKAKEEAEAKAAAEAEAKAKTTTAEGAQDEVNYDALSYQDLKKEAAKRAEQTGEAPADQKKATLLEYLKKKA